MTPRLRLVAAALAAGVVLSAAAPLAAQTTEGKPRETLFIGVDTSGSFRQEYDNAMSFRAYYLYGHLHGLGGLSQPPSLFVAGRRGRGTREPQGLRARHELHGEGIA